MPSRREFILATAAATVGAAAPAGDLQTTAAGAARSKLNSSHASIRHKRAKGEPIRLAIVGTGEISPRYLKKAAEGTRVRFVATCARTIESAKSRAIEYGIDSWFDDYVKMYDDVKPDGVVIATPHTLHAEQSIAALNRGIHVLCEKPMATSWEDCKSVVAAAQRSGAVFLALPYDSTEPILAALEHINERTLGVFTGAESQVFMPGGARDLGWDRASGGGAMLSVLVYPVSRLVTLLGPASRVTGFVNTLIPHRLLGEGKTIDLQPPKRDSARRVESTIDDNVSLLIEWPSGQQAIVRCLWGTSFVRIYDTAIYGRHGTLWINGFMGNEIIIHSPERAVENAAPTTWNGNANCYRIPAKQILDIKDDGLLAHFADCIEGIKAPTCGGPQQLHVHEILFKGFEAARSGRAQNLETTFTHWYEIDPTFHDTRSRFI